MPYVVYDQPEVPGPPAGTYAHPDVAAAEDRARLLVGGYEAEGWRVVERVLDGLRRRWVLRRGNAWAAVELRHRDRGPTA